MILNKINAYAMNKNGFSRQNHDFQDGYRLFTRFGKASISLYIHEREQN